MMLQQKAGKNVTSKVACAINSVAQTIQFSYWSKINDAVHYDVT